jgi:LPXTG-motif cell wall-anchored protein
MRNLLLKTSIALLCLILLSQLAVRAVPGAALAQPARPTLTATSPPAPTRKPDRKPTETPVPTSTELPTATAAPAPTEPPTPTAVPAPMPAQLPTTGDRSADWSAALLLALLLLVTGMLLRPRRR